MKKIMVLMLSIGITGYAHEPVAVQQDEDFDVGEVVARLDDHMRNVKEFYASARRCASIWACRQLGQEKTKHETKARPFDMQLLRETVEVTHPVMIACFNDMEQQQSLEPFFVVWSSFKTEYTQCAQDQLFCREVAFLDMHLYSTMLGQLERSVTRVSVGEMLALYRIIASLPMYELLALLDGIAREIIGILDQSYNGEDSFFVWLWHNWWVPPTVVASSVSSLVEGIATIMNGEDPEKVDDDEQASEKNLVIRAI